MNPARAPTGILVIGYGNTLRGDDGVGPWLAEAVAERRWPDVRGLALAQLMPELAESLAEAQAVVFVDARLGLSRPEVAVAPLAPGEADRMTTHACDPQSLLALAERLFGRAPRAWLVTVPGSDFELGETLSASCHEYAQEAMRQIEALVRSGGVNSD